MSFRSLIGAARDEATQQAYRPVRGVMRRVAKEKAGVKRTFDPHRPMPALVLKGEAWDTTKRRGMIAGRAVKAIPAATSAPAAARGGDWNAADAAVLPIISSAQEIRGELWEIDGSWMLDVPHHPQKHHHTWQTALAEARELPPRLQTGDVWIRFRQKDDAGIQVFDDNPVPVEQRLMDFELERREVLEQEDSYRPGLSRRLAQQQAFEAGVEPDTSAPEWSRMAGGQSRELQVPQRVLDTDAEVRVWRGVKPPKDQVDRRIGRKRRAKRDAADAPLVVLDVEVEE